MKFFEAIKNFSKIRFKTWDEGIYLDVKEGKIFYYSYSNTIAGRDDILINFVSEDWEEYKEQPEVIKLKVIDCFSNDFHTEKCSIDMENLYISKGWETVYRFNSRLAMVKYEVKEHFVIVEKETIESLDCKINVKIKEGFQPYGSFKYFPETDCHSHFFMQTMVKYEVDIKMEARIQILEERFNLLIDRYNTHHADKEDRSEEDFKKLDYFARDEIIAIRYVPCDINRPDEGYHLVTMKSGNEFICRDGSFFTGKTKEKKETEQINYKRILENISKIIEELPGVIISDTSEMNEVNKAIECISRISEQIKIFKLTPDNHKLMYYRDQLEPFLNWQENRADNKPKEKEGGFPNHIIAKYDNKIRIGYWRDDKKPRWFFFGEKEFTSDNSVEKWAYIPE